MIKNAYIKPETQTQFIHIMPLLAFSGGGTEEGDPIVDDEADEDDGVNRSRRPHYNCWEDEEEELEE